jgi:CYTH domain-containing protein
MSVEIEIERKYIIKMPSVSVLRSMSEYSSSEISQTYLECADDGVTERVRMRAYVDGVRFYHTVKHRIDGMSTVEDEREISRTEYDALLMRRDRGRVTIEKVRHTFSFGGFTVEIDKYKGWEQIATLEVELPSRDVVPPLPDLIEILFEATGNFAFSNASLSEHFPTESEILSTYL